MYVIAKCTSRSHIFNPKTLQQQVSRRRAECPINMNFPCGLYPKTESEKPGSLIKMLQRKLEVFNSDFSVLAIAQNQKLEVEKLLTMFFFQRLSCFARTSSFRPSRKGYLKFCRAFNNNNSNNGNFNLFLI